MKITIFDTSVCTENLGDFIIMDAVRDQLSDIFPQSMVLHTTTHDRISRPSYKIVNNSRYAFVGGTNLLSSNMNRYNQWKINMFDAFFLKDIILMGVGWWQYQKAPNFYTRRLVKSILNADILHSVRDSHTELMLRELGIDNVINTSCPTMWGLDSEHCDSIPHGKADRVVTTLTDYNRNPRMDLAIIELLLKNYEIVYFWPQGTGDLEYLCDLNLLERVTIVPPRTEAYNSLLSSSETLDFVGTRLHAGVRALQNRRRSIVLGIDNRAAEKGKDFNLVVCERTDLDRLEALINSSFSTSIRLPIANIERWKKQFQ